MRTAFKLKVLTPMFMGGADPQGEPELRAASIRGAMRFWFRAMAGAVTDDPREIYRLESEIFGNTEKKSKVVVRVLTQLSANNFAKFRLLPHKSFTVLAIKPEEEFEVELRANGNTESKAYFDLALYSFWLSVTLGGWGRRSRRGAGTIEILNVQGNFEDQTKEFLSYSLKEQLDIVKEQFSLFLKENSGNNKTVWPFLERVYKWHRTFPNAWDGNSPMYEIFNKHSSYLKSNGNCLGDIRPRYASPIVMRIIEQDSKYSLLFSILKAKKQCGKTIEDFINKVGKIEEIWHA